MDRPEFLDSGVFGYAIWQVSGGLDATSQLSQYLDYKGASRASQTVRHSAVNPVYWVALGSEPSLGWRKSHRPHQRSRSLYKLGGYKQSRAQEVGEPVSNILGGRDALG
jgi:hypothetical protein